MSFLFLFAAERYQITCVRLRKTYKSRQAETKQKKQSKNNAKNHVDLDKTKKQLKNNAKNHLDLFSRRPSL